MSFSRMVSFRANFLGGFLITVGWQALTLASMHFLTSYLGEIGGWSREELFVLIGTGGGIWGILMFLFWPSLTSLPRKINDGSLDFLLTKPINQIFLASMNYFGFHNIINGLSYFTLALVLVSNVSFSNILLYILFCIIGLLIQYFIWLIIVTLTFHVGRLDGTFSLFAVLASVREYPISSYKGINVLLLILIFPLILVAQVPAEILLNKSEFQHIFMFFGSFVVLGVVSITFWNFSIKRYTSASS